MSTKENIQFGKRLRELRKKRKMTQEQLAEKAGLHYKFIGRVEKGTDIKLSNIAKIAQGFEMPIGKFLDFCFPRITLHPRNEEILESFISLLENQDEKTIEKVDLFLTKII